MAHARHGAGEAVHAARHARAAGVHAGERRNPDRSRGVRRLPHRSARRRWRVTKFKSSDCSGTRDSRARRGDRGRGGRIGPGRARRCSLARLDVRICVYCRSGRENLCDRALFTGYTRDGGYATHALADARYCFPLPARQDDAEAAPLLCAGLIGWRSYRMANAGEELAGTEAGLEALGLYGFGAAAHILAQVAVWQGRRVYAFTRVGDEAAQAFARSLGAVWAGGSDEMPPEPRDAAIIFAPIGPLVPVALKAVKKGGRVVCGGIHMSGIPSFPYRLLWEERHVVSVANLTRADAHEFLALVPQARVKSQATRYPLAAANDALADLRAGRLHGAAVLIP